MVARALPGKRRASNHPAWPLTQELAVQTMYLADGLRPCEIAKVLQRSAQSISSLIFRRGWTQELRKNNEKADKLSRARTEEHVKRVVTAQASVAEAASVQGLKRALDCATQGGEDAAKDFRSWAGGSRDMVQIARLSRGLVDPGKGNLSGDADTQGRAISLSFFIGSIGSNGPSNSPDSVPRGTEQVHVAQSPPSLTAGPCGPAIEIEAIPVSTHSLAPPPPSNARKSKGKAV